MRKITRKALTITAAAAGTVALTALPAFAATGVSLPGVTPPSFDEPITGQNDGNVVAFNTRSGAVLICTGLAAKGTVDVGSNLTEPIGEVKYLTFSGCSVNGLSANVTAQDLPWTLETTGTTSSGVTPGRLSGVNVHVEVPSLNCGTDFQGDGAPGEINGTHANPANPGDPSRLELPFGASNNLKATNSDAACPVDLVQDGDGASLAGVILLRGDNATGNEGPTVIRT
ncbi:MAG: hypothetical protein FWJ90_14795 [Actinomadura sp.]